MHILISFFCILFGYFSLNRLRLVFISFSMGDDIFLVTYIACVPIRRGKMSIFLFQVLHTIYNTHVAAFHFLITLHTVNCKRIEHGKRIEKL